MHHSAKTRAGGRRRALWGDADVDDVVAAALDAGVPCAWVLGDSVYGSDKSLRVMLESRDKPYVLSIHGNERLMMGDFRTHTAEDLAAGLSGDDWRRLPAGEGSKGPRLYDWAELAQGSGRQSLLEWPAEGRLRLFRLQSPPWDHWLLIRRSIADPTDMAFYVTFAPHVTELKELAAAPLAPARVVLSPLTLEIGLDLRTRPCAKPDVGVLCIRRGSLFPQYGLMQHINLTWDELDRVRLLTLKLSSRL
jgi:hypothetical protein